MTRLYLEYIITTILGIVFACVSMGLIWDAHPIHSFLIIGTCGATVYAIARTSHIPHVRAMQHGATFITAGFPPFAPLLLGLFWATFWHDAWHPPRSPHKLLNVLLQPALLLALTATGGMIAAYSEGIEYAPLCSLEPIGVGIGNIGFGILFIGVGGMLAGFLYALSVQKWSVACTHAVLLICTFFLGMLCILFMLIAGGMTAALFGSEVPSFAPMDSHEYQDACGRTMYH